MRELHLLVPENLAVGAQGSQRARRWKIFMFTGCWLLLLLFGWMDYITGYELGFFVFYSLPIGLAAWHLGRWAAIGVALGATVAWWLADALAGAKYSSAFSFWWNSAVHFAAFLINAVTIARIKLELQQRDELSAKLKAARQDLRRAAKALPFCPLCGKIHPQTEPKDHAELRDIARDNTDLSAAFCAECAQPGANDAGLLSSATP